MRRVDEMAPAGTPPDDEPRVERLLDLLPNRVRSAARWLRRPSSRWVRIPAGLLLMGGSLLSILPLFGLWMLPLGLLLLSEDVPSLRRLRRRVLDWLERRRPDWFRTRGERGAMIPDQRGGD
jgi:hypothetical protein